MVTKPEKLSPSNGAFLIQQSPKKAMQKGNACLMDKRKRTNQWKPNERHEPQKLDDRKLATCTNDD